MTDPASLASSDRSLAARGAPTWPEDRVETLKRLWRDGLSASVIGRRLGVSRNAVLGKIHRLGLSNRGMVRTARPVVPKVPRPRRPPAPPRVAALPSWPPPAAIENIGRGLVARLEAIPAHGCHFPMGDPKSEDFAFCGRPVRRDPYCDEHRRVAYRPGGPKPVEGLLKRYAAA